MSVLGRRVTLALGQAGADGLAYTALRVAFRVEASRTGQGSPATAAIRLYNPSDAALLALAGPLPTVTLAAGHASALDPTGASSVPRSIFRGDVTEYHIGHEGPDRVLEIEAEDGGRAWATGRIDVSFATPTTLSAVVAAIAAQLGIPVGVVALVPDYALPSGGTFSGPARDVLDRIARTGGAAWSIVDGVLHVAPAGAPLPGMAPLLSAEHGTLLLARRRRKGGLEIRALLDAAIRPGSSVVLAPSPPSPLAPGSGIEGGVYVADDVRHVGDSGWDAPYYTEAILRLPGA